VASGQTLSREAEIVAQAFDTSVHLVQTLQLGQDDERVELDTGETL